MKRITSAILLAAVLSSGAALANTPGHGRGPHGHGDPLIAVMTHVKDQLNLNTSQQQQWDSAVAQAKSARQAGRGNFDQVKAALHAELAKPEPDLAAVAAVADGVETQNRALHKQVRDAWLALYGTFTPDQKAVVKTAIAARVARMEAMHDKMAERFSR